MARLKAGSNLDLNQTLKQLFPSLDGDVDAPGLKLLAHELIEVRPQPRVHFDSDAISELSLSISELREQGEGIEGTGILQPILVAPIEAAAPERSQSGDRTRYRLIAGERRFRASQGVGLPHVPALVLPMREEAILLAQLVENLQRQALAPLDEARGLQQLMSEQGLSYRDAAKVLGKTRSYLTDRLALLKMGMDVQEMVSARADTLQHARLIDAVKNASLRQELIELTRQGAARREIERRIATSNTASHPLAADPESASSSGAADPQASTWMDIPSGSGEQDTQEHSQTERVTPQPDQLPSAQASDKQFTDVIARLRAAVFIVTEAARLTENQPQMTSEQAAALEDELTALKPQIDRIERKLGKKNAY